jgi:hypothetical protein
MSAAWTAEEIRAATPFPKPEGQVDRFLQSLDPGKTTHWVLQYIAEHGDIIDDGRWLPPGEAPCNHRGQWLLVPISPRILDVLAQIDAELADLDPGADAAPDQDDEPSLGANEGTSQVGPWRPRWPWDVDVELDAADEESNGDDEPEHSDDENCDNEPNGADLIWAPDWPPKGLPVFATADEQSIKGGDHG